MNKKVLVVYFSKKGSSRFVANKLAQELNADIEELKPRLANTISLLLGFTLGNKKIHSEVKNYEKVIVCGPVWIGKLLKPMKDFLINNKKNINSLYYGICCASSEKEKNERFGYNKVISQIEDIMSNKCKKCEAFSIMNIVPEDKKEDDQYIMKLTFNETNFKGKVLDRFNNFLEIIKST